MSYRDTRQESNVVTKTFIISAAGNVDADSADSGVGDADSRPVDYDFMVESKPDKVRTDPFSIPPHVIVSPIRYLIENLSFL